MPTLLQSWIQNHAALEAQGRKLAIYVGPGGNAGVISGGIATALYTTGSLPPHAHYIGASVGAFCWMYTLIAKDYNGPTIFGHYFQDSRYFSPRRLFTKSPSLNLDYVLNDVLEHRVPIPYEVALTSPHQISVITTCEHGKLSRIPLSGQTKSHIQKALRATASMPLIGRVHDEHLLEGWDGWLVEPYLLEHLSQHGITDVVWIANRPIVENLNLPTRIVWHRIIRRLTHTNPQLAEMVKTRLTAGNFLANPPSGINLEIFEPHINIPGTCRNSATLFHALGTAYKNMASYLGHPNLPYPTEWQPWQHHMP